MAHTKPVLGFSAFSGTGKTTLLKQLIPLFADRGIRVAVIKHAHHDFDIDKPGKDSYELRKAGARQMLVASGKRWALMTETDLDGDPELDTLVGRLDLDNIDLVLVEGFKHVSFAKIELRREALGKGLLYPDDPDIIAVASDHPDTACSLPSLDINDIDAIATFILTWLEAERGES